MVIRALSILSVLVPLSGCALISSPEADKGIRPTMDKIGVQLTRRAKYPIVGLIMSTPPYNTLLFGPCEQEFGMPDSRRGTCDLYYSLRDKTAPWDEIKASATAREYPSGELYCTRTIGTTECVSATGAMRPPLLTAPNMGAN